MPITVSKVNLSPLPKVSQNKKAPNPSCASIKNNSLVSFCSITSRINKEQIEIKRQREINFFNSFLQKEGRVTTEEYQDIKKNHPSVLLMAQKYCEDSYLGRSEPEDVAYVAQEVDDYLKARFKDNYRVISLGTSPAIISKGLEHLGCEVIFLPVSGLRDYNRRKGKIEDLAELRALMQYLGTKNINDGKLNVIFDYTDMGTTLKAMTKFIKEYFSLDKNKIKAVSLNDNILDFDDCYSVRQVERDLTRCNIEMLSCVPHFPVLPNEVASYDYFKKPNTIYLKDSASKQELFKKFEDYSTALSRAFSLCMMNEIDNGL